MPHDEHPRKIGAFQQALFVVGSVSVTRQRRDRSLLSPRDPSRRPSSLLEHLRVMEGARQSHMGLCSPP